MTHILQLIFLACLCEVHSEWVDPHSMDTNTKSKMRTPPYKGTNLKEEYCSKVKICDSDLYLRRIVRLILNNAYLDRDDAIDQFTGHVNLHFTKEDYEFLINFSQNDDMKDDIFSEVGSIFEVALQKPSLDRYKEVILTLEEQLYFFIFNPITGALVASATLLYVIYKLLRARFTWRSILRYLFFLMYIADFLITYLEIRKDDEINNMVAVKKLGTAPPECDPRKLSWWSYMKTQFESTFFEHPCKNYYEMVAYSEYKYLVAPTRILTRQFRTILVEPLGDLGEAFGKFGRQMFTNLPWGLNVAIFPIMLIASCLIIFIVLLFITKPRFKISLFHFFTLEIGDTPRPQPRIEGIPTQQSVQRIRRREVGYNNAQHRPLIEDASNDNNSSIEQGLDGNEEDSVQKCIKGASENAQKDNTVINNEQDANNDKSGTSNQTELQS